MKVSDKRGVKQIMFCHLPVGAVFQSMSAAPNFYMKTSIVEDANGKMITNAVRLDNGLPHKFDDDTKVIKVEAELIIT